MAERRSLTARLPSHADAQRFLRIVEGTSYQQLKTMIGAVLNQTGTPQAPVNWSKPAEWIPERLSGANKAIALRLWEESEKTVNPRYCQGHMSICMTHELIDYSHDRIDISEAGRRFLNGDESQLARMDDYDGILVILSEVAAKGPAQRKSFYAAFRQFCHTYTTWRTEGSVKDALGFRLDNLLQRSLVEKSGPTYRITIFGLDYLERFGALTIDDKRKASVPRQNQESSIYQLAAQYAATAREELRDFLQSMNPYQFEHLIKRLLEEMGYENVEVTSGSHDKGVDVVADIELGISRVKEVIQVKRQKSNIGQPVVNQLRGSLGLFDAARGSIITTGGFTKGAKEIGFVPNLAPITLIDGERLLDMLIEHDIGIRRSEIKIMEFDHDSLSQFEPDTDLDA